MRLLVVEDDDAVRSAVRRAMLLAGYEVVIAADGEEGMLKAGTTAPDAIILDLGLPVMDGMEVCRRLRSSGNRTPILMLTARDAIDDRVDGLDAGADDYLIKPYDVRELQARVRTMIRRQLESGGIGALRFGELLELDADAHAVHVGTQSVDLTRTEYQLLELFMLNPRRVLPSELIYERVWGYDSSLSGNSLRVYIGYLRRKLEAAGAPRLIHTFHGVGYVLREP